MCYAVFLASRADLPVVLNAEPLLFSVETLSEEYDRVRAHFPAGWHVRYVGSSSGCSCELRGDASGPSRIAFAKYLSDLPVDEPVCIYNCWEGDFAEPIEDRVDATIADLLADEQLIAERRFITLTRH